MAFHSVSERSERVAACQQAEAPVASEAPAKQAEAPESAPSDPPPAAGEPDPVLNDARALCDIAQEVLDDGSIRPDVRYLEWTDRVRGRVKDADFIRAAAAVGPARDGYVLMQHAVKEAGVESWECPAVETVLSSLH